jgi:hypothetical protein
VTRVVEVDAHDAQALESARAELAATSFERVLSFDDEEPLCALARALRHLPQDTTAST